MTEYHVRSRPGGTTVRVSRPGGVTRVRTRLAGGSAGGAGLTGDSEIVADSTTLTGPPHTIAVAAAGSIDITVTLPDATVDDKGLVWYIRNLNSDSVVYVANLAEGDETITESKGLLVAGIETDTPGTYTWMKVGFVSETAAAGGGADLSDATPQALGTAAAGTGTAAARDDHVHAMPTAADVGADADGAAQAVADTLGTAATKDAGSAGGVAELDVTGKVPSAQLPSYVDDVVEVANFAALPGTGETGKIYVTVDTNVTYRWSGSAYVEISASLALGETSSTAYRGDRGKTAYDHSQVVSGNPHGTTATDVGADPAGTAAGLVDDLSGVSNQATARTNLGLGTAATAATGDFAATSHTHTGTQVTVDASGFNGNLTTSDDTVQEIAQKLDDLVAGGTVASVISSATFPGFAPIGPNHAPTLGSVNHGLGGLGREAYAPFFCPAGTYDAIGVLSTVAAVSTWRLGIDDNTAGWPGAVLLDAGTVNMNATAGWQVITGLTFTVTHPRWLWTHAKCVAYTASPSVQCLDGVGAASSSPRIPGWPTYGSLPTRALVGAISFLNSGSAGVLTAAGPIGPNSATQVGFAQTAPLILLRRSS